MLSVGQAPRAQPLPPSAVLGLGPSALSLAARLLELDDARLLRLRVVVGREILLVLGASEDLPWSDGVTYLAREPSAPELLLPCVVTADVPAPLLLRALLLRLAPQGVRPPFALSFEPPLVLSIEDAQQPSRHALAEWRAAGAPP